MLPDHFKRLLLGFFFFAILVLPHTCSAQDLFQTAQQNYSQQNWAGALEVFQQAAEQAGDESQRVAARFYAAECAFQLQNYAQALTFYKQVLDSSAAADLRAQASFRLAECWRLAGDLAQALAGFQRFVEAHPHDGLVSEARNHVSEILLETRRYEAAIDTFAYVMENEHGRQSDRARLGMARGLIALKRYDEVAITLGQLCQSSETTTAAEAVLLLGRAKYESGQYDQALATFRRVYDLRGSEATGRARIAAGWALWKLARLEEVAVEVEALATDVQFSAEYHYLLGMTAYSAKDWQAALKQLEIAADSAGEHRASALFYAGESTLLAGNPTQAKSTYSKLLKVEPHSEWADDAMWGLVKAARANKSQAEFDQACEHLRLQFPTSEYVNQLPLVAIEPHDPLRQHDRGTELFEEAIGLERDGRYGGAIAAFQELLAEPSEGKYRAEAIWRAARLHERIKQYAKGRQLYTQLLAEFPDFDRAPVVLINLARVETACGNQHEAAKYCRELLEKFPQSSQAVEASYWLALAAADDGKVDEAQWQVDWLLDRLNSNGSPLSENESRVLGQTLCLECQLFATEGQWQGIDELLSGSMHRGFGAAIDARLSFWRAEAALRLSKTTEARKRFEDLTTETVGIRDSWVPMVTLRRAQLAARQENWQAVLKLVDELDLQYPEFELAYECDYLRGRALAGRGEMSAARVAYVRVLENDWAAGTETAAMAQWMIGEAYFHQRNYELARVAYERVIERHQVPEWQARAALQAGKCAELCDNWEAAADYYADAAERWQDTESAHELSSRLRWVKEQTARKQSSLRR